MVVVKKANYLNNLKNSHFEYVQCSFGFCILVKDISNL